jgi:acyl-CoA synthetase (AMP-forming)/AMP-acid ligase II
MPSAPQARQDSILTSLFNTHKYLPSSGLPSPVNDILIMKDEKAQPIGEVGEIWLRGPNVMKEYWGDRGTREPTAPLIYELIALLEQRQLQTR